MRRDLKASIIAAVAFTLIFGLAYPLIATGVSQVLFHHQADGSQVKLNGRTVGSSLIGQSFSDPKHFWSRPSATSPQPYNGAASSASNLGPLNPALTDGIKSRIDALRAADPNNEAPIPVDLVTASGSGLDPDISLAAAFYQAPRVARSRGLQPQTVMALIAAHAHQRWLGILGEPRVNVLEINLALDGTPRP